MSGADHGHHHDRGLTGALRYLRHGSRMWHTPVAAAAIDLVGPDRGETIVDIGAGMGATAVPMAARGATVVAVDPTPFMRRVLGLRRLLSRTRDRLRVVDGAAEEIPLGDDTADVIVSVNTMHHWTAPDRAAAELRRVLREGGRLVLIDENFDHPDHELHDDHSDHHHDHGMHMVDPDEMADRLRTAGFHDVTTSRAALGGQPCLTITARG